MGHLLNSGEVGNIGLEHLKQIRSKTINKWDSLGFLEGLKGHVKENIAQLYENQASSLLNEATDASSSGSFETVVFPIVRRVFSKLLANDIVSVQAMNMPIGKLFYFVPKTSGRNHAPLNGPALPGQECVFSACVGTSQSEFLQKSLYDVLYNNGMFDASKGTLTITTGGIEGRVILNDGSTSASTIADQLVSNNKSVTVCVTGFSGDGAGRLTGPDGNEMDTETFLSSLVVVSDADIVGEDGSTVLVAAGQPIPYNVVAQKYGQGIVSYGDICTADGCLLIQLDLTGPACIDCTSANFDGYQGQSGATLGTVTASWGTYASLEFATEMGEVSFELDEVVVSVTERKLRATWSPELAQDVSAFHNIDAEAELTALLSEQVAAEIDREIMRDLRNGAAWSLRWDYNGWKRSNNGGGFNAYTQKEWNQTLITKINQLSAQIHKSTLRGGANFVIVSSEVSAIFDDLEYFHVSNASPEQDQYNMGIEKVGSLGGRYTVYRDPYAPANSVIVGHKGKSLLDTGYIYAPYVPLQLTPTLQNPFNFAPVKGIMTRYAKKMVNNRFYGKLTVDGVVTFDPNQLR